MVSAALPENKLKLYLTGFGEFHGVSDNPTMHHCEWLQETLKKEEGIDLKHAEVVFVAIETCDMALSEIYGKIQKDKTEDPACK